MNPRPIVFAKGTYKVDPTGSSGTGSSYLADLGPAEEAALTLAEVAKGLGDDDLASRKTGEKREAVDQEPGEDPIPPMQWSGAATFADAQELVRLGWPVIQRRIQRALATSGWTPRDRMLASTLDVAGARPDIQRYLAGDPACMRRVSRRPRPEVVRIFADCCISWMVPLDSIIRRGLGVLALIDRLDAGGVPTELYVTATVRSPSYHRLLGCRWLLKPAGGYVRPQALAFWLAHPAVLRRLGFAAWEHAAAQYPEVASSFGIPGGGYGHCLEAGSQLHAGWYRRAWGLADGDIALAGRLGDAHGKSDKTAIAWAMEEADRVERLALTGGTP